MSNYSNDIEERKERKEKRKVSREKLAGFFYDLAKIVFAGLVVGGISPIFNNTIPTFTNVVLIASGIMLTFALAYFANRIMNN